MKIEISKEVKEYLHMKNYEGILVKIENHCYGWGKSKVEIRGEFLKNFTEWNKNLGKIEETDGVKVFIPEKLYQDGISQLRITSIFSPFEEKMRLNIEVSSI